MDQEEKTATSRGVSSRAADELPCVRWARCVHDGRLHAVDCRDAELTSARGYAEALCGHTIAADGLVFEDAPSGALCMPCVMGLRPTCLTLEGWARPSDTPVPVTAAEYELGGVAHLQRSVSDSVDIGWVSSRCRLRRVRPRYGSARR